jgi:lipocalin
MKKYEGMWYQVYSSSNDKSCDSLVFFYFSTGEVLNMTSYCIVKSKLVHHEQKSATILNRFDPCKLVVVSEGILGTKNNYWIYYTDYVNYAIVGDGNMNSDKDGSNYVVLSRSPKISEDMFSKVQKEIAKHAI